MIHFIIDMIMIFIISIFVLGHAFIISLLIIDAIEKHKKKKQKEIEYKRKHSGYYKIMAPRLDLIDKPAYKYNYDSYPELYYTYGIGFTYKGTQPYRKKGTSFELLPSAGCSFVEMTQDEYDEFEIKYRIDPDLIKVDCISAPNSTKLSSIKLIEDILKLPEKKYDEFLAKYRITYQDLDIAYKKLIK